MASREARPRKPLGFFIMKYFIYYLHKGDNIPCYIGKTKNKLQNRLVAHRRIKNQPLYEIEFIDKVDDWRFFENFYIELFTSWGFNLENLNKGGGGLTNHTRETKNKISKSHKHRKVNWGNKISQSMKLKNTAGAVFQYTKDNIFIKEWEAACIAEDFFNPGDRKKRDNIRACIRNEQKTAYGYIWLHKSIGN